MLFTFGISCKILVKLTFKEQVYLNPGEQQSDHVDKGEGNESVM